MAPSGKSQPHSRSHARHEHRALLARIERELRGLPLAESDIAVLATRIAGKLARFRGDHLWHNPAFLDIRGKLAAVCGHFAAAGLTLDDYLRAARLQPQLFYKSPAAVVANVERVVAHFFRHDLTLRRYLHAALDAPLLFATNPDTVIANVEAIVSRFAEDGLTLRQYLEAALKQPQLFYQPPATIIRRLDYLIGMHRQGLLTFPGQSQAPPEKKLAPLFAFLSRSPIYLTLADDNYELRKRYAQVTGDRPTGIELLTRRRSRIEEDLSRALDNARHGRQ